MLVEKEKMVVRDWKGRRETPDSKDQQVSQVHKVQMELKVFQVHQVRARTRQRRMASCSQDTARKSLSQNALQELLFCTVDTHCCSSMETTERTDKTWVRWVAVYLVLPPCPSCSVTPTAPAAMPHATTTPIGCPPTNSCQSACRSSLGIHWRTTSAGVLYVRPEPT